MRPPTEHFCVSTAGDAIPRYQLTMASGGLVDRTIQTSEVRASFRGDTPRRSALGTARSSVRASRARRAQRRGATSRRDAGRGDDRGAIAARERHRRVVDGERHKFTSRILPPYVRRSPKVDAVLPLLYLNGLSTGDFQEALPTLLGDAAAGLSPSTITRLTHGWGEEHAARR